MTENFIRTISMIGEDGFAKLQNSSVAIFGCGGVGGYAIEGLARCGVGSFHLCDCDVFSKSNLNRQILATTDTLEKSKTQTAEKRILSINPSASVEVYDYYFSKDTAENFPFEKFDYIIDCIDSITSKILLCEIATAKNIPIISSMGTGNKTDITKLAVSKLSKTSVCPLARVMRSELKKRNIDIKVVFSTETPTKPQYTFSSEETLRKDVPSSMIFVPAGAGLMLAREVVFDLIDKITQN
ncbi:MAG: tRNA threonylcarbamoyladenosine dehydratase [Bacillota bacterium]